MAQSRRLAWVPVALVLVLVAALATWWLWPEPAPRERPEAAPEGSSTVVAGQQLPPATRAPSSPGDPLRLVIPDLDVDANMMGILAPGGVLVPPSNPQVIGWWADGARPGDDRGSALVTGHTVSTGGGALDDLDLIEDGAEIRVESAGADVTYEVSDVEVLSKHELATEAESLFSQSVSGRLVVVTCEDWDGEAYLSNVVVTAKPVTSG